MPHDNLPKIHRLLLKRCALGDKDAYGQLQQMYWDQEPWEREGFLKEVIRLSDETREKLKQAELLALEESEAKLADIAEDEDYEEELRGEEPGGYGEDDGGGDILVGA